MSPSGEAGTALDDLGDPTATTAHALCVYGDPRAGVTLDAEFTVPVGLRWLAKTSGFHYRDRDGSADGVVLVKLAARGDGRGKLTLKARGPAIAMAGADPAPGASVTVQ